MTYIVANNNKDRAQFNAQTPQGQHTWRQNKAVNIN